MILTRQPPDATGYVAITDRDGNDHRPFLRFICDNPAEDFPRTMYADRLEEWGWSERAEYIREACSLSLEGSYQTPPHGSTVTLPLLPIWHNPWTYQFRRGFIEKFVCSWQDWFAHAAAIREMHPVTRVALTTWPDHGRVAVMPGYPAIPSAGRLAREIYPIVLASYWPGIAFTLPPTAERFARISGQILFRRIQDHYARGAISPAEAERYFAMPLTMST